MNDETIRQLLGNCGRSSGRSIVAPHEWTPHRVELPDLPGFYYSDAGAWDLFIDWIASGRPYNVITLDTPFGAQALTVVADLPRARSPIYIKVQLGYANRAIGRSFHYTHY